MSSFDFTTLLDAQARAFLAQPHDLLIHGERLAASNGERFGSEDPATGREIAQVAHAAAEDVALAVGSASRALAGEWSGLGGRARGQLLLRLAELIERDIELLAQIESLDSGKPKAYIAAVDIPLAVAHLRYNAEAAAGLAGSIIPVAARGMHVFTRREPVGVVAAIVPWNFALCQACFKIAPALAAGCTVVLKPAEQTPLSALKLGELALEAGFPPGVLNVLTGFGSTTGQALVEHPGVAKIAFTGSEAVGKHIARSSAATLKHLSLELGGKNPNIIFADADLETAALTAAQAIFFYSGQVCTAGSRLLVQRPVYEQVARIVVEQAAQFTLGHGLAEQTHMGPLISQRQLERVCGYVDSARREGIELACGGQRPGGELASGYFMQPTVLLDVSDSATVAREEIFGPVLVVQPFDSLEEVVARANDTSFGLAAGVWTRDMGNAQRVSAALASGTVWVNTYNQFDAAAPFGGYKQSGYGRDGGREGLDKYLQTKTVWVNCG